MRCCGGDCGLLVSSVGLLLRLLISLRWVLLQQLQHRRHLTRHQHQLQWRVCVDAESCVLHEHPVTLAATATAAIAAITAITTITAAIAAVATAATATTVSTAAITAVAATATAFSATSCFLHRPPMDCFLHRRRPAACLRPVGHSRRLQTPLSSRLYAACNLSGRDTSSRLRRLQQRDARAEAARTATRATHGADQGEAATPPLRPTEECTLCCDKAQRGSH